MPSYIVSARDPVHAVQMQARREREIRQKIRAAHLDSAYATLRLVVQDTGAAGLVDSGVFKAGWEVRETEDEVLLENNTPYGGVLESGARPFTPPLEPLIAWVERKAKDFGFVSGGKRYRGRASLTDEQRQVARQIALAIQQKFRREGLKPRYIMRGRLDYAQRAVERAFREYLDDIAKPGWGDKV